MNSRKWHAMRAQLGVGDKNFLLGRPRCGEPARWRGARQKLLFEFAGAHENLAGYPENLREL